MGYNLNFVSTPHTLNKKDLLQDINKFNRRIILKSHFGTAANREGIHFKSKSTWEPANIHHTVKTFTENFTKKVTDRMKQDEKPAPHKFKNLNKSKMH